MRSQFAGGPRQRGTGVACATTGLGMLPQAGGKAPKRRLQNPRQPLAAMRARGAARKEARPCADGWKDCWHSISPCDGGASDTSFACPLQLTMRLRAGLRCAAGNKCRRCEEIPGPLFWESRCSQSVAMTRRMMQEIATARLWMLAQFLVGDVEGCRCVLR